MKSIRLHIVVFRESDGSDPVATEADIVAQMAQLNGDYRPYGIEFTWTFRFVSDSNYRVIASETDIEEMKQLYARTPETQCNVFVADFEPYESDMLGAGTFPWEPFALEWAGGVIMDDDAFGAGEKTLTHEMGHVFGLLHTFTGVDEVDECGACYERADGLNADATGDFASDTPPTPENYDCGPPGGVDPCSGVAWGATQPENFMSYADDDCLSMFTSQQAGRMHCWIEHSLSAYLCHVRETQSLDEAVASTRDSIDVSGSLALIRDDNLFQVYRYGSEWAHEAALPDLFGHPWNDRGAISSDDETIVVSNRWSQTAFVFKHGEGGWVASDVLQHDDPDWSHAFGTSCDIARGVVAIGAPGLTDAGSIVVFRTDGPSWSVEATLTGPGYSSIGDAVAISEDGTVIVAGSTSYANDTVGAGAAYVYRNSNGTWTQEAILTPSNGTMSAKFGSTVAISNDTIVVGTSTPSLMPDFVYVYRFDGTTWVETQILTADVDDPKPDGFGVTLDISGDLIAVANLGLPLLGERGRVDLFRFDGAAWSRATVLRPSPAEYMYGFGVGTGLSGNRVLVGDWTSGTVVSITGLEGDAVENASSCGCPADLGGDGSVGTADLLALLGAWGGGSETGADLDGDGVVGVGDLLIVLAAWGGC